MSQRRVLQHEYHHHHGLYTSVNQNKNDFSICLKVPNVTAGSRSAAGRALQVSGLEVLKAYGPRVTVCVRGMSSWPWKPGYGSVKVIENVTIW